MRSHQLAAKAWDDGFYADWVVPVAGRDGDARARRGHPPGHVGREAGQAQARVREDGTVTAGNASPLNDGAGALLLGDRGGRGGGRARAAGADRGARRRSPSTPTCSASRRSRRPNRALERAGIGWGDIEVAELNEAFAAQSLACLGEWDLDPERLNVNGGAIAIGHPLGASGVRILGTLVHELRRRGGGWGIAAICIGVGQGLAVVVEA